MKELEERIRRDGTVKTGDVLKVDAFLNHQCDVRLFDHMGQEWARHFAGKTITKILTIEASGIGIACCAARHFGDVPVVFVTFHGGLGIFRNLFNHCGIKTRNILKRSGINNMNEN